MTSFTFTRGQSELIYRAVRNAQRYAAYMSFIDTPDKAAYQEASALLAPLAQRICDGKNTEKFTLDLTAEECRVFRYAVETEEGRRKGLQALNRTNSKDWKGWLELISGIVTEIRDQKVTA